LVKFCNGTYNLITCAEFTDFCFCVYCCNVLLLSILKFSVFVCFYGVLVFCIFHFCAASYGVIKNDDYLLTYLLNVTTRHIDGGPRYVASACGDHGCYERPVYLLVLAAGAAAALVAESRGMGAGHAVVAMCVQQPRDASTLSRTIFIVALPYFGLGHHKPQLQQPHLRGCIRRAQARCTLPNIKYCICTPAESFPSHTGPLRGADLRFHNFQPHTSLHCDTGPVHRVVCLSTPQFSLVLILPTSEGWPG